MNQWSENDIPDQSGRTALITGGNRGLGLRIAEVLASRGARVIVTSRDPDAGETARELVAAVATDAAPEVVTLDLADLESVSRAVDEVRQLTGDRLDLLVNNAGIMMPPLGFNAVGLERQWATNVIGAASLTWQLLPAIEATPHSRVGFTSSLAHFSGSFDAERLRRDARGEDYNPSRVYGRTKFADLLLSRELERHFLRADVDAISVAAHPGYTATGLIDTALENRSFWQGKAGRAVTDVVGQSVERGALPMLYALTEVGIRGSQYFGPGGLFELRGEPARAARHPGTRSDENGATLLAFVEQHAGVPAPR